MNLNGIEYAMMQSNAEGFDILQTSEYDIDLAESCHLWNRGSAVRSWLLEPAERAFIDDPGLEKISDHVEDSGEGRWMVEEAIARSVPAALRNQFGGHPMKGRADDPQA
jgi:6-phosphogluconate dehydrogenase